MTATAPTLATLLETGTTTSSYTPRTMRSLAQQGYLANPTVFRAVNIIAQTTASIPLQVYQTGRKRVKLESHPLLSQLNKPNEEQTRSSFIEKLISYWLIAGTAYMFGSFSSPRRPPAGLFPLRPDLTDMVLNSDNSINHYTYAVGSSLYRYAPWQVRPIRSFHPLDDFYGASPLSVAWAVIERQNEGEQWNYSLIKHAARPSGAFVSSVNLSDVSRLTLKREIDEKYKGAKRAGTPLLLEGGLTYVQLSLSPIDMDWIQADAGASRKLAMAIGVDPLLLNDKEHSTYNNVREARLALIDLTSLPLLGRFVDELNVWLAPYYGEDIEIAIDEDYIAKLRDDKQTSASIAVNGFNAGTHTLNEARSIQGLDVLDDGDFMKLGPQIYVRITDMQDFLTQQAERRAAPPLAPPQLKPPTPPQKIDALLSRLEQKATHEITQESYIRHIEERRVSFTPLVQDSLTHFFRNQHSRIASAIKTVKSVEQAKTVASTTIDSMTTELFDIFLQHYTVISNSFSEYTGQVLKASTTVFTKEVAQDFLKQAEAAVSSIQDTTKGRVERILEEGRKHVKDFDGYDWATDTLDDMYAGFLEERAEDIANQVICDASNLGNYWAARNTGLPLKHTWLSTLDEKTREDHRTAHGQTQYLEMPYEVGYDHFMLFPGDKSYFAPIAEWANCRCTEWYELDENPQDNPYYQERLRQREVEGKARLPFQRWAKFNPNHSRENGQFTSSPVAQALETKYPQMRVDFGGIAPQIATDIATSLDSFSKKYPEAAKTITYIGSGDDATKRPYDWPATYGYEYAARYNAVLFNKESGKNEVGSFIQLNKSAMGDAASFQHELDEDDNTGWHPKGLNTPKAVLDHELGHVLETHIEHQGKGKVFTEGGVSGADIGEVNTTLEHFRLYHTQEMDKVSRYAKKGGEREAFAEAYAELQNKPRAECSEYAQHLGDLLDTIYARPWLPNPFTTPTTREESQALQILRDRLYKSAYPTGSLLWREEVSYLEPTPERMQKKFNPYHDNLGRFAHTPAGLAPPGQPPLPGLDPWTDINVGAFQQPHLTPLSKPGTYTEPFQPHEDIESYPQGGSIYDKEQYLNHWQEREVANLDPKEEAALTAYTDGAYTTLNRMLRDGDDLTDTDTFDSYNYGTICDGLDSFLEKNTIEVPMEVYRGVDAETKGLFQSKDGTVFTDNGFVSTSIVRERAAKFTGDEGGALLTIKIPKGQHGTFVEPWSANKIEEEFLLPRSQRFRVLSYEMSQNDNDQIIVELLPEGKTKNG